MSHSGWNQRSTPGHRGIEYGAARWYHSSRITKLPFPHHRLPPPRLNTAETFLKQFYAARNLEGPNGQPLYRYHISPSEFDGLRDLLSLQLGDPTGGRHRIPPSVAMSFCLWAAEWWHRNYEAGPWKWEPLLDHLGHQEFAPDGVRYPELKGLVARGLAGWGRQLLKVGRSRAFLSTLACEGGLPMKLILREGTHLRSYLKSVLEEYRLFGSSGVPLHELAERVRHYLPRAWQQKVVYQLSGELIAEVWRLQRELGDTETPVVDLNRTRPCWRDELPVRVTDDIARTLLNGLLLDAAKVARGGRIRLRWNVNLVPVGEDTENSWELQGAFELPATLGEAAFRQIFELDQDSEIPYHFELGVEIAGQPFGALAVGTERRTPERGRFFGLEGLSAARKVASRNLQRPRTIVARTVVEMLRSNHFHGATGLSDLPWVFVPTEPSEDTRQSCRLAGQGSVKRREPWVLVAVSTDTETELGENGEAEPVGSARNESQRRIYRVMGKVAFIAENGSRATVETRAETDTGNVEYHLLGRERTFGRGAATAFRGGPVLREVREGEFQGQVPERHLQWKPDCPGGKWRPYSTEAGDAILAVGSGLLRFAMNDDVRYSTRASILPKGADIRIVPSTDPTRGEVWLDGFGEVTAGVSAADRIITRAHRRGNDFCLELEAVDSVPDDITVCVDWKGQGRIALPLPFPVKRAVFIGRDGSKLPNRARVPERALSGMTAEVVAPYAAEFEVHGLYSGRDAAALRHRRGMITRRFQARSTGYYDLDLSSLQREVTERLELSEDPHGTVKLDVFSNHPDGSLPPTCIIVHRSDLQFQRRDGFTALVGLDSLSLARVSVDDLLALQVEALPLLHPDKEPHRLERFGNDAWTVPHETIDPGPYLISGRQGDWHRARPMFWYVGGMDEAREVGSAGPANAAEAYASELSRAIDPGSFQSVARGLAHDPDHADWPLVFGYLQLRSLPVTTFPLLRAIASSPSASAMAAVVATSAQFDLLWERMESFPFAWWQVPLGCWRNALSTYSAAVRSSLGTALSSESVSEALGDYMTRRVELLRNCLPGLDAALQFLLADVLESPLPTKASRIAKPAVLEILEGQYEEHQHAFPAPRPAERDAPVLRRMLSQARSIVAEHLWLRPLFVKRSGKPVVRGRADFGFAPALAGALVVTGTVAPDDLAQAMRGVRARNPKWFDDALQLAQLIAFGRQQASEIDQHL